MKKNKKLLPLISSLALLTSPVILVTACSYEITRYPAALPNDQQNRILFDFINVNYSVNAKSHFNTIFQQGMEFIKKEVEGIMAQEEFIKFFIEKLGYDQETAENTFLEIKDNLGLNILATDYFNTINSGQSFDSKDATKLIFQTDNWHQFGTTRFEYKNVEFYETNNPDTIFIDSFLYDKDHLNDNDRDELIKTVAKHADTSYNDDIVQLTSNKTKWDSPTTPEQIQPAFLQGDTVQEYQKKLERFKWWLRFRYQQYYSSVILPQLNQTLFTMANILNLILDINPERQIIDIVKSNFSSQLQNLETNTAWTSKYRLVWDYTVNEKSAIKTNREWNTNPLEELMLTNKTINDKFFTRLSGTDKTVKSSADPIFGINGFVVDTSSKSYDSAVKDNKVGTWALNGDGNHYWNKDNKGTFAYSVPVYWIDVVKNLDFKFYANRDKADPKAEQWIPQANNYTEAWNRPPNESTSASLFSQYMRADYLNPDDPSSGPEPTPEEFIATQNMKWNTFWQMLYWLSSQIDTNPNKQLAADNFEIAAKKLFPEYIAKEKIYNIDFWNAVSSYY